MGSDNSTPTPVKEEARLVPRAMETLGPFAIRPCDSFKSFELISSQQKLDLKYSVNYNGKNYKGYISPKSQITLPPEIKAMAKIHPDATHFVWGYSPMNEIPWKEPKTHEELFLSFGGYVYLKDDVIVGINAIDISESEKDLLFKGPYFFGDLQKIDLLKYNKRFQDVTISALKEKGIMQYCWLYPGETHSDGSTIISTHGAFLYLCKEESFYFKVKGSLKSDEEIQKNTPIWEWSEEQDQWITYDIKKAEILEEAYHTDAPTITLSNLRVGETSVVDCNPFTEDKYTVDLKSDTSVYNCTNSKRKVRRILYGSTQGSSKWAYSMQRNATEIWVDFFPESNSLTDQEYLKALRDKRISTICITINNNKNNNIKTNYQLDFEKMTQKNGRTGHTRDIRRVTNGTINASTPNLIRQKQKRFNRRFRNSLPMLKVGNCFGVIMIKIEAAKNLAMVGKFGTSSDPIVVVTTNFSSFFWQSTTKYNTVNPLWNETVNIKVASDSLEGDIIFTFYHYRLVQRNLYLGRLSISLYDIVNNKKMCGWKPLNYECREKDPNTDPAEVSLSISFIAGERPSNKNINIAELLPGDEITLADENVMEGAHSKYKLTDKLGEGSFAVVKKGINLKDNSHLAVKIIQKSVREDLISQIVCEIKILGMMKNDNCVSIVDYSHTAQHIYIAMEFCNGDMFEAIINNKLKEEADIKIPVKHILMGLSYLHQNFICHRDIKPENIMYHQNTQKWKIVDFGISCFFTRDNPYIEGSEGTLQYMAPEIYTSPKYTKAVDIWSTGILCYVALTKRLPYPGNNEWEVEEAFNYSPQLEGVSSAANNFVWGLMRRNPNERSIEDSLKHPWLK